jgi:hypothetical protein
MRRNDQQSSAHLINSSHYVEEENDRIYLNQLESSPSVEVITEPHQHASMDITNSTHSESNDQEQVFARNKILALSSVFLSFRFSLPYMISIVPWMVFFL